MMCNSSHRLFCHLQQQEAAAQAGMSLSGPTLAIANVLTQQQAGSSQVGQTTLLHIPF
jgi:hypothetical protein